MSVPPSSPQDTQAVVAVLVAIAVGWSVIHWRAALKVILIVVVALVVYGTVTGFHDVSSLLATHRQ